MTREEAIQAIADWMALADIPEDAEPEEGAAMLLEFMEETVKIKGPWSVGYENH